MPALSTVSCLRNGRGRGADGLRQELSAANTLSLRTLLRTDAEAATVNWYGARVTQVFGDGDVGTKIVLAVVGDGFAATDQPAFNQLVDALVVRGLFGLDYFRDHADNFIVLRLGLVSAQSGVGTITFQKNADGTFQKDDNGLII